MYKYRLSEHTADTGLEARGETLAAAFASAAYGMFAIIAGLGSVREAETRRVVAAADDIEGLLFEWLNSLLYYFDVEQLIFRRFDITELSDTRLVADCRGEKYDPARHRLKTGVKAATYHQLTVDKARNRVRVIFDI
jgi:SHS2 domain-containing protein